MKNTRTDIPGPRLVAWELTQRCNLKCSHCRASAVDEVDPDELTTEECYRVIDDIVAVGSPLLILTGGEPLLRSDIISLATYARGKNLPVAVGTNGTLISDRMALKLKKVPVSRLSVSLDFPNAELQDSFRGVHGAFDDAIWGIENARRAGLEVQINCTITKKTIPHLDDILSLAINVGAVAFHPFLLVPTGRGKLLKEVEPSPAECERVLRWMHEKSKEVGDCISFKPTCAPFYWRISKEEPRPTQAADQSGSPEMSGFLRRGCLAGTGFCFISHVGRVQGCGYLTMEAGNIKKQSFADVWQNSPLFSDIRDLSKLKGKCAPCSYKIVCGGCRARAYEKTGDYLEAEPYCAYRPRRKSTKSGEGKF